MVKQIAEGGLFSGGKSFSGLKNYKEVRIIFRLILEDMISHWIPWCWVVYVMTYVVLCTRRITYLTFLGYKRRVKFTQLPYRIGKQSGKN